MRRAGKSVPKEELAGLFFFLDCESADGFRQPLRLGDHPAGIAELSDGKGEHADVNARRRA